MARFLSIGGFLLMVDFGNWRSFAANDRSECHRTVEPILGRGDARDHLSVSEGAEP
ncbi:hypothetical protein LSG31_00805 [Fodinisporobacter ferrooxydans]|uniref:Uncharacterized protein n=1 Tax=Fodinisporobacter ferrooxydans TaxID=2901836 RepID=A0ABY4CK20_9BACL|nr:hypothetical protein LSG31_00805 [Alicyclobacillaceae bacterium MYW30-H2]